MYKAIKEVFFYIKKYPILVVILTVGCLVNLSFFFPIKGNIGHDVYWHLALIEVAFKKFPFQMPIFSGIPLQGYNYLTDFLMFLITRLGIPSLYVYFIVIPLLYVVSLSFLVIYFGFRQNKSIFYVASLTFFTFLATPFSYLLSLYKRGSIFFGFNYPTAMQSPSALTNISYALTIPILFIILIIFQNKKRTISQGIMLGFLVAVAFGLKFYGGIILLFLVGIHELLLFIQKKNMINFITVVVSGILFVGLSIIFFYDPFNSLKSGSIFAISPFAFPHNLIEDPDALYIPQLIMARYSLYAAHKFSIRLVAIETITVFIYLVYNFGTRLIGFVYLVNRLVRKKITRLDTVLFLTICVATALALTLIQKGGDWWNTVQFFGYGLLLFNFFAASSLYHVLKWNKMKGLIIVTIIVILTLPLNVELLMKAVDRISQPYDISKQEQNALSFLKSQKDGAIFALPVFSQWSYVPARSGKPVFFADETVISNLGIKYQDRKNLLTNIKEIKVSDLPVRYFYLLKKDKDYELILDKIRNAKGMREIYDNSEVVIYEHIGSG